MATFNAKSFEKKLKQLDGSQTGIQTLSLWIIHHRTHAKLITAKWLEYVKKVTRPERKLGLFYLANDVVQNGKRKAKDLTSCFAKVFKEALPLLSDPKIKTQVGRVLEIWCERNVFDVKTIESLKEIYGIKKKLITPTKEEVVTPIEPEKPASVAATPTPIRKIIPPDFKVSKLLVSIKKATSLENDLERKSKTLDNLKIDASSFDSVQHVKDRSSVGRFFKQFEESKIILDDYCHNLRRSEKENKCLMNLLSGGEAFYDLAQDEAKVIVKAYDTFGNRLNAMKKKLDSKIKKFENDHSSGSVCKTPGIPKKVDGATVDDMDIASDSGDEVPIAEQYNPSTAPSHHELSDDAFDADSSHNERPAVDSESTNHQQPVINQSIEQQQQLDQLAMNNPPMFFNPDSVNGMTSFMNPTNAEQTFQTNNMAPLNIVQTASLPDTKNESLISSMPTMPSLPTSLMTNEITSSQQSSTAMPSTLQNYGLVPIISMPYNPLPINNSIVMTTSNPSTPVVDENPNDVEKVEGKESVKNLIDSLFPMLSKSLQTIKEKQQTGGDDQTQPSVTGAMAFALGNPTHSDISEQPIVASKKSRFSYSDPNISATSPVSLTNPNGLSNNQAELINIAAGLTKFDENFLPVNSTSESTSNKETIATDLEHFKETNVERDKKRDERKSRHNSSRHKSSHRDEERHKRSSSRSPSRKSSARSSRDSRDDRHSERRRSNRRSTSPKRRKSRSSRPSSSNERDNDCKRRHSPYYNDRRSPTPEMDSQMNAPISFNQVQQSPQVNNSTTSTNPQTFQIPSNGATLNIPTQSNETLLGLDATNMFSASKPGTNIPEAMASTDLLAQNTIPNIGASDQTGVVHVNTPIRPPVGFMAPPRLDFDSTGRPILAPNFQLRSGNPLQLLPPPPEPQGSLLHLRPFQPEGMVPAPRFSIPPPPGILPFNPNFGQIPPSNLPNLQYPDNIENHSGESFVGQMEPNESDRIEDPTKMTLEHRQHPNLEQNSIVALSQQANLIENNEQASNLIDFRLNKHVDSSIRNNEELLPNGIISNEQFSLRASTEFQQPRPALRDVNTPIFRPRYRPRFATHDPLLDKLESRNSGHDFAPRFRPRFQAQFRPRFRPRFDARRPRF